MKKKILFITAHRPNRVPGQRFRFEQYLDALSENEFDYKISYIVSENDDRILYKPGNYFKKFLFAVKSYAHRFIELFSISKYDIIFIYREALLTRSVIFEKLYTLFKAKIIYDFDDAIWVHDVSDANKKLGWLKNPGKYSKIMKLSDVVFAGNEYLGNYAKQFNPNVKIVPTIIDTNFYQLNGAVKQNNIITIGWSGSITTIKHFEHAVPFLKIIKEKYKDRVDIKVIGDSGYKNESLNIKGLPWNKEREVSELSTFDIGIMPLPNDKWAEGKCGLKGLQYMALSIPTIMSPVGVNKNIIEHNVNGLLAEGTDEWVESISRLIDDEELRNKLGKAARKTVESQYSISSSKQTYVNYFNELIN